MPDVKSGVDGPKVFGALANRLLGQQASVQGISESQVNAILNSQLAPIQSTLKDHELDIESLKSVFSESDYNLPEMNKRLDDNESRINANSEAIEEMDANISESFKQLSEELSAGSNSQMASRLDVIEQRMMAFEEENRLAHDEILGELGDPMCFNEMYGNPQLSESIREMTMTRALVALPTTQPSGVHQITPPGGMGLGLGGGIFRGPLGLPLIASPDPRYGGGGIVYPRFDPTSGQEQGSGQASEEVGYAGSGTSGEGEQVQQGQEQYYPGEAVTEQVDETSSQTIDVVQEKKRYTRTTKELIQSSPSHYCSIGILSRRIDDISIETGALRETTVSKVEMEQLRNDLNDVVANMSVVDNNPAQWVEDVSKVAFNTTVFSNKVRDSIKANPAMVSSNVDFKPIIDNRINSWKMSEDFTKSVNAVVSKQTLDMSPQLTSFRDQYITPLEEDRDSLFTNFDGLNVSMVDLTGRLDALEFEKFPALDTFVGNLGARVEAIDGEGGLIDELRSEFQGVRDLFNGRLGDLKSLGGSAESNLGDLKDGLSLKGFDINNSVFEYGGLTQSMVDPTGITRDHTILFEWRGVIGAVLGLSTFLKRLYTPVSETEARIKVPDANGNLQPLWKTTILSENYEMTTKYDVPMYDITKEVLSRAARNMTDSAVGGLRDNIDNVRNPDSFSQFSSLSDNIGGIRDKANIQV